MKNVEVGLYNKSSYSPYENLVVNLLLSCCHIILLLLTFLLIETCLSQAAKSLFVFTRMCFQYL